LEQECYSNIVANRDAAAHRTLKTEQYKQKNKHTISKEMAQKFRLNAQANKQLRDEFKHQPVK